MSSLSHSLGTYLLAGSAFVSQHRTNHHLNQMSELAAASAALSLSADTQLESSFALHKQAAANAEKGLQLQSQSVEHESNAAKMEMEAASEMAISEEYIAEAETFHEHSAIEASESAADFSTGEELLLQSSALHLEAEGNLAASAIDEENSSAAMAESMKSGEVATAAEEKGAEYEAVAFRKEGLSVKDGEALLKTETGAMASIREDVEVMAACAPIPGLNIVCEAVGSIVEVGYQSIAAIEGAKAAVETIQGVTAAQNGRAEMILAARGHEEEARWVFEADQFQMKADKEGANASSEQAESEAMIAEAEESELMGKEKAHQSEEDEAMAAADEERAAKHEAMAARDEGIAVEEESSAIATQIKSEEILSESTSEEFEAMADQTAAESEMAEARKLLKQSVSHGMRSLGFALHAIITAGAVVYIMVMRCLSNVVGPRLTRIRNDPSSFKAVPILEQLCGALMHAGIIVCTSMSMKKILSKFDDAATFPKARALLLLAVVAGSIESLGVHATHAMISCCMKEMSAGSTLAKAIQVFLSNAVYLAPVVLMESIMLVVVFGEGFFEMVFHHVHLNPVLSWSILVVGLVPLLVLKLQKAERIKSESESIPYENTDEYDVLIEANTSSEHGRKGIANMEYGSMEDVCLLPFSDQQNHVGYTMVEISSSGSKEANGKDAPRKSIIQEYYHAVCTYVEHIRRWYDLLMLTVMIALLWHCWPVLAVLHPLFITVEEMITSWIPLPCLR